MGKVIDQARAFQSSRNQTAQTLDACMDMCGGLFGALKGVSGAILSTRGRKQPTLEESIRTGRKPDLKF